MISDNKNIQQLVALLVAHGIRDVVVCPGSRNAAIAHTMAQTPQLTCHAATDERSAGFMAIGMSLATGIPTAVCVTSGSALLNLHPAVAEATYQQVPLVVISADRPEAWIGQMDGQTMPQCGALGTMVRMSVNLPIGETAEDTWHANRLLNEALLECTHRTNGPVHINIPIREPFYEFHTSLLPEVRKISRIDVCDTEGMKQLSSTYRNASKRMIIVGQMKPDDQTYKLLSEVTDTAVIVAENLSNVPSSIQAVRNVEELLKNITEEEAELMRPDLIITIGGHIISKRLKSYLRQYTPARHIDINPEGEVRDLFCILTDVAERLPEGISGDDINATDFYQKWHKKVAAPTSSAVGQLIMNLPNGAILHLANSTAVREAQMYDIKDGVTVCCNRGINGIEGSVSSAVGYAIATPERENFIIIGDLSFHYDQNGLWNNSLPTNLHILLLNSKGGKIFDTLPVPDDKESRALICGTTDIEAQHLCEHYGMKYLRGTEEMDTFIKERGPVLLEINE